MRLSLLFCSAAIAGIIAFAPPGFAADTKANEPAKKPLVEPLDLNNGYRIEFDTDGPDRLADHDTPRLPAGERR